MNSEMLLRNVYAFRINLQISIFHLFTQGEKERARVCVICFGICTLCTKGVVYASGIPIPNQDIFSLSQCVMSTSFPSVHFLPELSFIWTVFLFFWSACIHLYIEKVDAQFQSALHTFPYSLYLNYTDAFVACRSFSLFEQVECNAMFHVKKPIHLNSSPLSSSMSFFCASSRFELQI